MDILKQHWENVFSTKQPHEVSWTQETPQPSLDLINKLGLDKTAPIIDIGGGDSKLVDYLLAEGYTNITVLDISATALQRAQVRLGDRANQVTWIISDIRDFKPQKRYALWHDRATFHFLTQQEDVEEYANKVALVARHLIIATFSETGPEKCSGLPVSKYNAAGIEDVFAGAFHLQGTLTVNHETPFATKQNFRYAIFKSRAT